MNSWHTIEELCDQYLGGRPPAAALAQMKPAENERPDVKDFIARMFRIMSASCFGPNDILPSQALGIGKVIPGFLPSAWGGSIPPFTWEHRHKRIDAYLGSNQWGSFGPGTLLLEMGCGFPPHTALDAARVHDDWQVVGADPCFDEYLLYDADGNYACLTADGTVRYFHAGAGFPGGIFRLYENAGATINRFSELFSKLAPGLGQSEDGEVVITEANGARLIRNPLRLYETKNLHFLSAGIGANVPKADIIRIFNVLLYFDSQFLRKTELWAAAVLSRGGLFICGADSAHSTDARYAVYRREDDSVVLREFAFSIDNVRPSTVMPWFAMHDDDRDTEVLSHLLRILRSDPDFRAAITARSDELFQTEGLFTRGEEGHFQALPNPLSPAQANNARERIMAALESDEFPERAAAVLRKSGIRAWVNEVRHVAVDPHFAGES